MYEDAASFDNREDVVSYSDKDSTKNLEKYKGKHQHSVRPQFSHQDHSSEDYSPIHEKHVMIDSANVSQYSNKQEEEGNERLGI